MCRRGLKSNYAKVRLYDFKHTPLADCVFSDDVPEAFFRQMTTCQTAASEFLRQFWSAIYAPASELQMLSAPTPAQKAAKAAKMVGYLATTPEKIDAIVRSARAGGLDPQRIQMVSFVSLADYL